MVKNHPLVFQHVEGVDSGIEACRRRICNESYERLKAESPPKKPKKAIRLLILVAGKHLIFECLDVSLKFMLLPVAAIEK